MLVSSHRRVLGWIERVRRLAPVERLSVRVSSHRPQSLSVNFAWRTLRDPFHLALAAQLFQSSRPSPTMANLAADGGAPAHNAVWENAPQFLVDHRDTELRVILDRTSPAITSAGRALGSMAGDARAPNLVLVDYLALATLLLFASRRDPTDAILGALSPVRGTLDLGQIELALNTMAALGYFTTVFETLEQACIVSFEKTKVMAAVPAGLLLGHQGFNEDLSFNAGQLIWC